MKRVLLVIGWTAGGYIGAQLVVGFAFGTIFYVCAAMRYDPTVHRNLIVAICEVVPASVAFAFLVLAIRRRLPGTYDAA